MSHWARHGGKLCHRPPWKVAINTALRFLQPWHPRPYVVASVCTLVGDPPDVLGYKLCRVRHLDRRDPSEARA